MIKIKLNSQQLKEAIWELPLREQAKLVQEIERKTWKERFKQLLSRIDARLKKNPISQKQIKKIVNAARSEYYDRSRR